MMKELVRLFSMFYLIGAELVDQTLLKVIICCIPWVYYYSKEFSTSLSFQCMFAYILNNDQLLLSADMQLYTNISSKLNGHCLFFNFYFLYLLPFLVYWCFHCYQRRAVFHVVHQTRRSVSFHAENVRRPSVGEKRQRAALPPGTWSRYVMCHGQV